MITRRDLSPGSQAVQGAHALADFSFEHPAEHQRWHQDNFLIFLSVPDREALSDLAARMRSAGCSITEFREPDLSDELTAICVGHSDTCRRLTSGLPLLFKELRLAQLAERPPLNGLVPGSTPGAGTTINHKHQYDEQPQTTAPCEQ